MSFGLKPSYFTDEDFAANEEDDSDGQEDSGGNFGIVDYESFADVAAQDTLNGEADENDEVDHIQVDADIQPFRRTSPPHGSMAEPPAPLLKLDGGFRWTGDGTLTDEEILSELSSDEGSSSEPIGKKKRKRKAIEQDLTADMHTKTPDSNADFERFLLGSPDSSYLWLQYMSFQLQLSEVEKARDIGRRALKIINFREEQEKLNVWIGLLNLENVYGTDETLEATFKEAARHNDSKTVHLRLASIFDQTEKYEVCDASLVST
jgi:rRNA biogenesis protein RRP5